MDSDSEYTRPAGRLARRPRPFASRGRREIVPQLLLNLILPLRPFCSLPLALLHPGLSIGTPGPRSQARASPDGRPPGTHLCSLR